MGNLSKENLDNVILKLLTENIRVTFQPNGDVTVNYNDAVKELKVLLKEHSLAYINFVGTDEHYLEDIYAIFLRTLGEDTTL